MSDILARLAAPFPPEKISWRVGSTTGDKKKGMALAYIDARDVQDRLTEVCGLDWQVRHPWSDNRKLCCEIGIRINGEWVWRGDGAGDSDVEAEKGAFSDSFKRAAVRWGVGRYLYDIDTPWVELKPAGRSFAIADGEFPKLQKLLARQAGIPAKQESAAPPAKTTHKMPPDKYDLLSPEGKVLATFDEPADWFHALRQELTAENAMVAAVWEINHPCALILKEFCPMLEWADRGGHKWHPYVMLDALKNKLLSNAMQAA